MREAQVVRTPAVQMLSFSAIGTPSSGASGSPARSFASVFAAASSASAGVVLT